MDFSLASRISVLQAKLAYSAACFDIEIYCQESDEGWYDLRSVGDLEMRSTIEEAVEYLSGIGLLRRHPARPDWVRPIYV